jgi:hypothetical protein
MGFWDDWDDFGEGLWKAEKFLIKAAAGVALGTAIAATGGAAVPLGAAALAEGYCIKKATEECDNDAVKEIGEIVGDSFMGGGADGAIGGPVSKAANKCLGIKACKSCGK